MMSKGAMLILGGLGLAIAAPAAAQASELIPIQKDLQRERRINEYLGRDVDETGSLGRPEYRSFRNPSGVVGFDGPPGIVGDSVDSYSPLPPGAPGNEDW